MFRGYDLRGIANVDLNPEIVQNIGRAYGTYLSNKDIKDAVVGRDCRQTSLEYSEALIKGIRQSGINVVDIGLTMIGTFYWSQHHLNIRGGVFVTASHNPAEYNGFKIASDLSETLVSDGMKELRIKVENDDYVQNKPQGTYKEYDINEPYFREIIKLFPQNKKLKILIDPSHTTAGVMVPSLLRRLGHEVIEMHCNIDPTFPLGTPDPTESFVAKRLSQEVVSAGADIGFTYDSDGDRIGIVDEKGGIIWNDVLLAIFAADVLAHHPGEKIMFNTLCSKIVPETIVANGGVPFMWRTGHSFLKKKNQEIKAAFIGELSGHFFFSADFYNHDDGIYSTVRLIDYIARTGKTLSEAVLKLPQYISSPEIKIGSPDDKKVALMSKISQILKKDYPSAEIVDDERAGDGVRLDMPDSMFVVRYSQNGPYLTIKFEARTQTKYEELKKYIANLMRTFPHDVDWSFGANLESLE
jgi:phosphomannomutase/phosphoglucomutase